jgi:hypothetical protein
MASPAPLSLKNFSTAAKASVDKALQAHAASFPKPDYRLGFIPPWWLGIIIDNPVDTVSVAEAQALAADIHSNLGSNVPTAAGATVTPGCVCWPGHIICGFIQPPDLRSGGTVLAD